VLDCLGTLLEFTSTSNVSITTTSGLWKDVTGRTLSVTPGYWELWFHVTLDGVGDSSDGVGLLSGLSTENANGVAPNIGDSRHRFYFLRSDADRVHRAYTTSEGRVFITPATTTSYYYKAYCYSPNGAISDFYTLGSEDTSFIRARRLA
jgi:hypothetical protein